MCPHVGTQYKKSMCRDTLMRLYRKQRHVKYTTLCMQWLELIVSTYTSSSVLRQRQSVYGFKHQRSASANSEPICLGECEPTPNSKRTLYPAYSSASTMSLLANGQLPKRSFASFSPSCMKTLMLLRGVVRILYGV